MRGQYSLFNNLIKPDQTPIRSTEKGRSKDLISKRDKRLLYRYYFYAQIHRMQYVEVISRLVEEFDLSDIRIIVCISDKHADLKEIFTQKPTVSALRTLYPWLNWASKVEF